MLLGASDVVVEEQACVTFQYIDILTRAKVLSLIPHIICCVFTKMLLFSKVFCFLFPLFSSPSCGGAGIKIAVIAHLQSCSYFFHFLGWFLFMFTFVVS